MPSKRLGALGSGILTIIQPTAEKPFRSLPPNPFRALMGRRFIAEGTPSDSRPMGLRASAYAYFSSLLKETVYSWNLTVLSLATLLRCLKHRTCSRHSSGLRGRNAGSGCCGGTRKRQLKRGRNWSSTLLASPMPLAPARRSSVTSRSWNVPAVRSTRPLAWGDRAKII